jgi:hypothetical protein
MGSLIANYKSSMNVNGETYCKAVGHHPVKREDKIICSNCEQELPPDTEVPKPGRTVYRYVDGRFVEIDLDEARELEFRKIKNGYGFMKHPKPVSMDDFANEFKTDLVQERRKQYE